MTAPAALAPSPALAYPLDYLDRGCLAATSKEHGCCNTPTWELAVRGRIDPEHCRSALRGLFGRYPACTSTVQELGGPGRLHYVVHPEYDLERLFACVDLRAEPPQALAKLRAEIRNCARDPREGFPFHLTLARTGEQEAVLFFEHHHALADGQSFIDLLQDFALFFEHEASAAALPPELQEVCPRRSELDALEIGRGRALLWGIQGLGIWLAELARLACRPLRPGFENASRDYRGGNGTVHLTLDRALLERWKPLRARHGISLSAQLAAALFLASRRWNRELGVELGWTKIALVAGTKPRSGPFRSFANHLGAFFASLPMHRDPGDLEMMRSIHAQVERQARANAHKKRLVFERAATARLPLEGMTRALFEGTQLGANLNLSNLIPLPFPRLAGRDWTVEEVRITTPTLPPFGIMVSATDYNGRLCFNFNHKESIVTAAQALGLARHFERALGDMAQALAEPGPPELSARKEART
jgi:hypothetical protein